MAAVVLPSHHLSVRLPSATISHLNRPRHAPFNLVTSVPAQQSTSLHSPLHAPVKSRPSFPLFSALASLFIEERPSEEEEFGEDAVFDLEEEDFEEDSVEEEEGEPGPRLSSGQQEQASLSPRRLPPVSPPPPELSSKEKKELTAYAHSLGKKLKAQQVGKFGVTPSVAASFVENLESNELLKIKVHNSCPSEFEDAVRELERVTGSVAISRIGHTVILYRPSIKKAKKKETEQGARKGWKPRPKGPYAAVQTQKGRRETSQGTRKEWKPRPRGPYAEQSQTGRRSQFSDRSRRRSKV